MKRLVWFVASMALAGGCASTPRVQVPAGNTVYGTYPFRSIVSEAQPPLALEGVVVLLPDTVVVTLKNSKCTVQSDTRAVRSAFNYYCGDYSVSVSRENPLRHNTYRVTYSVWVQERVCVATRPNPRTQYEECTRYGTERVQRQRVAIGRLDFVAR